MNFRISNGNKIVFNANSDDKKAELSSFSGAQKHQVNEITDIKPDYAVKTPIKYWTCGEAELKPDVKAHLYKLANGQKVIIVPKEGATVVKTYINSGSMNEPDDKRGISHFIEHNLFNGSEGLEAGELFKRVDEMGASTNASTGFAETNYYIKSHLLSEGDLENKIKMQAAMLEKPKFLQEMLIKEKGPVTSEINMITDNPQNLAINETLKTLFGINSTSADVIGGTVENIKNLTQKDVFDYYQKNYVPSNMVTVITGEVDADDAIRLVSKYFTAPSAKHTDRNYQELNTLQKTTRRDIVSPKALSTSVVMGFAGPENSNTKDKIIFDALTVFLTGTPQSRLSKSLDKIQLTPEIQTERIGTRPTDKRAAFLTVDTSEGHSEKALKLIYKELINLAKNPPTEEEMAILKKKLKMTDSYIYEDSEILNSNIGQAMLDNDFDYVAKFQKTIDSLSPQDLVDAAEKYMNLSKCAITVVHPKNVTEKTLTENHAKAVSFCGAKKNKTAINSTNTKEFVGSNNLHIVTNNVKGENSFYTLDYTCDVPAKVKPAVASVLSVILNKGTAAKNSDEFANDLDRHGCSLQFLAGAKGFIVNGTSLGEDAPYAIGAMKEVINNPGFNKANLEYAKDLIRETYITSQPSAQVNLMKELYKDLPEGATPKDVLEGLNDVSLEDVKGLYQYIMQNAKAKFVISAPNETNNIVKMNLGDLPKTKPDIPYVFNSFQRVNSQKVLTQSFARNQADVTMAYKFKTSKNLKDSVTLQLMNTILGGGPSSRLFSDLRESQKLAYRVGSNLKSIDNSGLLSMNIKTTTENKETGEISYDNLEKSLSGFEHHVKMLKENKVSETELKNAKITLKNLLLSKDESSQGKNNAILEGLHSFYGAELDNNALKMIDEISLEDIHNAAKYVFSNNPTVSIVASENTLKYNDAYLKSIGEVEHIK